MTLKDAWEKRLRLIAEAKLLISKAAALDKDRFTAPRNAAVSVWFASMDAFYASEKSRRDANDLFFESDRVWHNAIVELVAPTAKLEWSERDGGRGWACKLESGETFEP